MPSTFSALHVILYTLEGIFLLGGLGVWWWAQARKGSPYRTSRLPYWGISVSNFLSLALIVVAAWMLGAGASQGTLAALPGSVAKDAVAAMIIGNLVINAVVLGGLAIAARVDRTLPSEPPPPSMLPHASRIGVSKALLGGLLTFLAAMPVVFGTSLVWQFVLQALDVEIKPQDLIGIFSKTSDPVKLAGLAAIAIVVAPLWEELAFRGGLFRYLRGKAPAGVVYVLPALIFAAAHGYLSVFGPLVALAVVLGLAYARTGNILVPIVAHGLFNLNSVILAVSNVNV